MEVEMDYWDGVGAETWIAPGQTHQWVYGWGDFQPSSMCVAGPDLDLWASAATLVWATRQGKKLRIDDGPNRHEFYVTIHSDGPYYVNYRLQVARFS
jgi:hypothetical protein